MFTLISQRPVLVNFRLFYSASTRVTFFTCVCLLVVTLPRSILCKLPYCIHYITNKISVQTMLQNTEFMEVRKSEKNNQKTVPNTLSPIHTSTTGPTLLRTFRYNQDCNKCINIRVYTSVLIQDMISFTLIHKNATEKINNNSFICVYTNVFHGTSALDRLLVPY